MTELQVVQQQRLHVCENNWVRKIARVTRADKRRMVELYWNGQLVWTPALALYLCVGDRGPGARLARINNQTEIVNGERILYFQSVPTRSLFSLVG